ncbi:MAG: hypothetical protein ACXVA7_21140, partial [Isosphaeraceae bacterium]
MSPRWFARNPDRPDEQKTSPEAEIIPDREERALEAVEVTVGTAGTEAGRRRGLAPSRFSLILVAVVAGSALFVGGFSLGARVAT